MKLNCQLQVCYNASPSTKPTKNRVVIQLKKKSTTSGETRHYLTVITSKTLKAGEVDYLIEKNVSSVISKFLSEGKISIKFLQPDHTLLLSDAKCEELKKLIHILKSLLTTGKLPSISEINEGIIPYMEVSNNDTQIRIPKNPPLLKRSDLKPKQKKLVVRTKSEYPVRGFESTLETIEASGLSIHRFDIRLAQLRNLTDLDLSHNTIKSLPNCVCDMKLHTLTLTSNNIIELPYDFCSGHLSKTLRKLNLINNKLIQLPDNIHKMENLIQLKIAFNKLQCLPESIGLLFKLETFNFSNNNITYLPHSFLNFTMSRITIEKHSNPYLSPHKLPVSRVGDINCLTLFETTICFVIANWHLYKNKSEYLPPRVREMLTQVKFCLCGKPLLTAYIEVYKSFDSEASSRLFPVGSVSITLSGPGSINECIQLNLCSAKCIRHWKPSYEFPDYKAAWSKLFHKT